MTTTFTTEVKSNLNRLAQRWRKFRGRVFGDLLRRVGDRVAKHARDRIRSSKQTPDAEAWPARKSARFSHPLLRKSGKLLASIDSVRQSKDTINIGTSLIYAPVQQFGFSARNISARAYLGVGAADKSDLKSLINAWVGSRKF